MGNEALNSMTGRESSTGAVCREEAVIGKTRVDSGRGRSEWQNECNIHRSEPKKTGIYQKLR